MNKVRKMLTIYRAGKKSRIFCLLSSSMLEFLIFLKQASTITTLSLHPLIGKGDVVVS